MAASPGSIPPGAIRSWIRQVSPSFSKCSNWRGTFRSIMSISLRWLSSSIALAVAFTKIAFVIQRDWMLVRSTPFARSR